MVRGLTAAHGPLVGSMLAGPRNGLGTTRLMHVRRHSGTDVRWSTGFDSQAAAPERRPTPYRRPSTNGLRVAGPTPAESIARAAPERRRRPRRRTLRSSRRMGA